MAGPSSSATSLYTTAPDALYLGCTPGIIMWHFVAGVAAFLVAVVAYYVDDLIRKRRLLDGLVRNCCAPC